jgi:hypothetical protein
MKPDAPMAFVGSNSRTEVTGMRNQLHPCCRAEIASLESKLKCRDFIVTRNGGGPSNLPCGPKLDRARALKNKRYRLVLMAIPA